MQPDDEDWAKRNVAHFLTTKMVERGWTQSELARRADLPRDGISTYVRAKTLPGKVAQAKLAKALDCTIEELTGTAPKASSAGISLLIDDTNPSIAHLRVSQSVPTELGLRIVAMLTEKATP